VSAGPSGAALSRYPGRCRRASHLTTSLPRDGQTVCLHGRLVETTPVGGWLADRVGRVALRWSVEVEPPGPGAILEVVGRVADGGVVVEELVVLAPAADGWEASGEWQGQTGPGGSVAANLRLRGLVLEAIRSFFSARGFLEVETPALVLAPGQEAHLVPFETRARCGREAVPAYLITSPEHHMKRLLAAGHERIYQLCRCFRDEEISPLHNPEFTMLEWYRAYAGIEEVLADTEELIVHVARSVRGNSRLTYQGRSLELGRPWPQWTVRRAFAEWAGIDLDRATDAAALQAQAREQGCASVTAADSWEDVFYKVLLERVEPGLTELGCAWLLEYPARFAALARLKDEDPTVAERGEAYLAGLELANGFTELNDPEEQRARFVTEASRRTAAGRSPLPFDEGFLRMLTWGMPPAGGMALGVDRLVMVLADAPTIDRVIAFPFPDGSA
jgi:lysyl-tRNA synthetase class 2